MSFNQVAGEVSELYGRGDFVAAMALVQGARSRFPEEDNTLTFWEACLLSRTGRLEEALGVLEEGLARGEWWPPGMLADEDLDPLRELPRWEPILQTCCAIAAERMADRPQPLVRDGTEPGGRGTERASPLTIVFQLQVSLHGFFSAGGRVETPVLRRVRLVGITG